MIQTYVYPKIHLVMPYATKIARTSSLSNGHVFSYKHGHIDYLCWCNQSKIQLISNHYTQFLKPFPENPVEGQKIQSSTSLWMPEHFIDCKLVLHGKISFVFLSKLYSVQIWLLLCNKGKLSLDEKPSLQKKIKNKNHSFYLPLCSIGFFNLSQSFSILKTSYLLHFLLKYCLLR